MNHPIPRVMSTQHPDNVRVPFFAESPDMAGESETLETEYVFSVLHFDEQMWDFEGKLTHVDVVQKMLARIPDYFRANKIGGLIRLTLRVPNPRFEDITETKQKIFETLQIAKDAARAFYNDATPLITEAILPFTETVGDMQAAKDEYNLNIIPLFENEKMLLADEIVSEYAEKNNITDMRVFIARSDPAMRIGFFATILMTKRALQRLYNLREKGITIHPIIGVGSAPFRGYCNPYTLDRIVREYPSVATFTLQSAAKFDFTESSVQSAIEKIKLISVSEPTKIDEVESEVMIIRYTAEYKEQVSRVVPLIQKIAPFIPARRQRRSFQGKNGYARQVDGQSLPRAIGFTCSLYSLGIPPELIGLAAIENDDITKLDKWYPSWRIDLEAAAQYLNPEALGAVEVQGHLKRLGIEVKSNDEHNEITSSILNKIESGDTTDLEELILKAATIRNFLG